MRALNSQTTSTPYFRAALAEARKAFKKNEVPIGAVLVKDGRIIARAYNQTEQKNSFIAHAEILCILKATKKLKSKYLSSSEIYVTLEPCLMCQYAARLSRVESIHFLTPSQKFGATGEAYRKIEIRKLDHELMQNSLQLLQSFFLQKRYKMKK